MGRISSIFNFSQIAVFRGWITARQARLALFVLLLLALPVYLFDRMHPPLLMGLYGAVFAVAWMMNRPYRRHLVIVVVSLMAFCLLGELYFRVRYFGPAGLSFDRYRPAGYGHPWSALEYDESTYSGLKPDQRTLFLGQPFTVNRAGFRGRDYSWEKPAGVYRIVVSGPSAAMGTGVDDDETFTVRVESHWNAVLPGRRVEVINLSVGGSHAGEMLHALREVGLRYDPDMLLICLNQTRLMRKNMAVQPHRVRRPEVSDWKKFADKRYRFFSNRFFFLELIRHWRAGKLGELEDVRGSVTPAEVMAANLDLIAREFRAVAGERRRVAYLLKPIAQLDNPDHDWAYREWVRGIMEEDGAWWVDTYEIDLAGYKDKDLMIYPGDSHPNATLHALYAQKFIEILDPIIRQDIGLEAAATSP